MKVVWLWSAVADLNRLEAFVSQHEPDRAGEISETIRNAARSLEQFPERCRRVPGLSDFRELFVEARSQTYVIQFRIAAERVVIVRIWHGREDRDR